METVVELSAPKTTPSETRYAAAMVRTVPPYLKACVVELCKVPLPGHILSKPPGAGEARILSAHLGGLVLLDEGIEVVQQGLLVLLRQLLDLL